MIDVATINASVNLVDLIGRYTRLRKVAANEWAGACPRCGGDNRLHTQPDKWFCRVCHHDKSWDDAIGFTMWFNNVDFKTACTQLGGRTLNASSEQLAQIAAERAAAERAMIEKEKQAQQSAIARLQQSKVWEVYHHHPKTFEMWRQRGLSDSWIRFYRLGYCPAKEFMHEDKPFTSPTLTIPYWRIDDKHEWQCIGLRHRLLLENAPGGKYRPEFAGLGNHLFYADPVTLRDRKILIVEGEIKAMVTWAAMWDDTNGLDNAELLIDNLAVIGSPGESWKAEYLKELEEAQQVYICLDPDTFDKPKTAPVTWKPSPVRMKEALGDKAQVIRLPDKIDDLINDGIINAQFLVELLR